MKMSTSAQMFQQARKVIPGGVNSPVRACRSVGCDPLFIERAQGASVYDVDGNEFVDFVCSWGPMILGHCPSRNFGGYQRGNAAWNQLWGADPERN